jgi:hypothetical protein
MSKNCQNKLENNHDKITTKAHLKRCEKAKIKGPKSLNLSNENNICHSFQYNFYVFIFLFYFIHLPLTFLPILQKKTAQTVKNYPSYASFRGL